MFAIELSKEKRNNKFLSAWFSDLPAINATSFSGPEKLLKFEAEGREFANCLRSLEQFMVTKCFFNLFLEVSHI
jgi:hypothetical protein